VFHRLHDADAKPYVCFPFGYTCGNFKVGDQEKSWGLLFPDLCKEGYNNVPPADYSLAAKYIDAIKHAVFEIHRAGVRHGDMYPSNVMWRDKDGTISIKVIDWDSAFFESTGVPTQVAMAWEKTFKLKYTDSKFGRKQTCDYDHFMVEVLEWTLREDRKQWGKLSDADNNSSDLNKEFQTAQERFVMWLRDTDTDPEAHKVWFLLYQ
jgi:serine/threonine protein kinase